MESINKYQNDGGYDRLGNMDTRPQLSDHRARKLLAWRARGIRSMESHALTFPMENGERSDLRSNLDAITLLESIGRLNRYSARTSVFEHGEPASFVFVVRQGRLKLCLNSRRGRCVVFGFAVAADLLGLSAVLNQSDYQFRAETLEPSALIAIPRNQFLQLFHTSCQINLFATLALARDHGAMLRGIRRLELSASVRERLAQLLLNLLDSPRGGCLPMSIRMNWTFGELAEMVNSTRETVNRIMRQLEREGLIALRGSLVIILDHARLELLAG